MNVVEVLNGYPGETFIQEHARAMVAYAPSAKISWAFVQTEKLGSITPPVSGLQRCIGLINRNRLPFYNKVLHKIKYFGTPQSYTKEFKKQILRVRPDLIHFHFAGTTVRYMNEIIDLRIPFSVSVRGSDIQVEPTIRGESYLRNLKSVVAKASGVHAVTDDLKNLFVRYCGQHEKVTVIRTCINQRWFSLNRHPEENLLMAVGRLHWRKGFSDLLQACAILKSTGQMFRLIVIGEGSQRQVLEFMIRDLGLEQYVDMVGKKNHNEMISYLEKASFFISSSLQEGFPNVVAEAMAAGVPVISTDCGGVEEIIQSDVSGFIAKTGDPIDRSGLCAPG